DALAQAIVSTSAIGNKALVLQEINGQTANMLEVQDHNGALLYSIERTGTPAANTDLVNKNFMNTAIATAGGSYVAVAGTTPLTGNWGVGNFALDNIST